jgi:hypothetical protein
MGHRIPGREPATSRPVLYRLQYGFRFVSEDPPVEVDQKQGRFVPESNVPGRLHGNMGAILLGKKTIPYSLSHKLTPYLHCT